MIGEFLIDVFFGIFERLISVIDFFQIPGETLTSSIAFLSQYMKYAHWIVGLDVLALFTGSIVFWWGVHLSIGLAVWVWEKLPLT